MADEQIYTDEKVDVSTYKCPNCGAEALFDANKQQMHCPYCDSFFDIENNTIANERELAELIVEGKTWQNTTVYQCETCGFKEVVSNLDVVHSCPFCGTNNIVKTDELPGLRPQGILPFKFDTIKASTLALSWAKGKVFAPNNFKKSAKAENIHGVYYPVFTFDSYTKSVYDGELGRTHVEVRHGPNGQTQTRTRTEYFHIHGKKDLFFDDELVVASNKIEPNYLKKLEPFSTNKSLAYKEDYLRGFSASTYSKDGLSCWNECKKSFTKKIEKAILKSYIYDIKVYLKVNTTYEKTSYKYVLLPVYVGNFTYSKKVYNFFVNGETGKISGKSPVSFWKVFFTVLITVGIVSAIILAMYFS